MYDAADEAACWAAVTGRDRAADGRFVYAVSSTGVFCRPSCPSRPKRRANVGFYPSSAAAAAAGFRACLRCRPDGPSAEETRAAMVAAACRTIEAADGPVPLEALAAAAGLSRFHFHRSFAAVAGVTPAAYAAAWRRERVQRTLAGGGRVTDALYEAGFGASSRFYAAAPAALGMAPSTYRAGATGQHVRYACAECSLGVVLVAATVRGVCAILLGETAAGLLADLRQRLPQAAIERAADFSGTLASVTALVDQPGRGLALPLDIAGTAFQQRVWAALQAIPAGRTASYAEVAAAIGAPGAARAVAGACAANPLAVAVPCHRIIHSNGGVSGYRWGIERKMALLAREASRAAKG